MREKTTRSLYEAYPSFYAAENLRFGLEVDDGWFSILKELGEEITHLGASVTAAQVKEKFGSLRVYVNLGDSDCVVADAVGAAIQKAEEASESTCEVCGAPGSIRGGGWLKCLCDEHAEGRNTWEMPVWQRF